MTSFISPHDSVIDLAEHAPGDLVGLVPELVAWNSGHGQQRPCLWQVVVEHVDSPGWGRGPSAWLDVGTAGSGGALRWVSPEGGFVPVASRPQGDDCLRDGWIRYASDHSGYPCRVHRSLLAPLPVVWSALADLVRTRARPELPAPWRWEPVEDWSALVREPA
ncbi:hypothetical protein KCV87_09595 [Actinosynnema pretiosum subsp. pretiosum]|uniref:Uncharacterized protein n=1 Tax=Actinosynnema pretiosum subsp. pretiosum TaxID=103721 RepID=A0AA45L9T3_9PSEU|nr:hypothetical protein APASM_2116 [Actinosynnema pretiosum subsp. pretiosum]QUF06279.1 hypothetical protein KCV87_09595 [Actinosynnema pretiosum subsp. pretiosum]